MTRRPVLLLLLLLVAASALFGQVQITTTSPLPQAYQGINYTYTFTANVQPPSLQSSLTWSIPVGGGSPPAGYGMSANGTFSGNTTQTGTFTFPVTAQAGNFYSTVLFSITVVTPTVNINSTSPLPNGFLGQFYSDTLSASSTPAGVTWFLADGPMPPGINISSNGLLSGNPTAAGKYTFTVAAEINNTQIYTTQAFTITVFAGQLTISTTALPNAVSGKTYAATLTANQQGVTWALSGTVPPGITFNTASGVFGGSTVAVGIYPLQITATLPSYPTATANLNLYVTTGPLGIPQPVLPAAVQGSQYTATVTATGGITPYGFVFVNSSTNGLSISSAGIISGIPLSSGSFLLPVSLSDATGQSVVVNLSLFVATPLSVLTQSLPNGNVGTPYSQVLQGGGGTPPLTWTLISGTSTLPPGLSLSNAGTISGTPTTAGSFPFSVQVTDAGGRTAQARLSIAVSIESISITTNSLPNGLLGVAYSQTLGVTGGAVPYTWRLASGALPQGLILDPAKGTISGTPNGALLTSTFTIQVSDSSTPVLTASKAFTINVSLVLSITTLSLPTGTVGAAYPATQVLVSGGATPYIWSLTSGALPPGLSLNSNSGAIGGTPTATGASQFTVTVTDAGGQTVSSQFSITINAKTAPLSITTSSFSATVGSPISQSLTATGGAPPYTWSATGLPSGVQVSGSTLAGTPAAAGSAAVALTVTDSQSQTATATITITLTLPPTPPASIGTISGAAASQAPPVLTLSSAFVVPLTGSLTASFTSSVGGSPTEVGFISSGGGLTSAVAFSVDAGKTSAVFANAPVVLATGTVAGTITLTAKMTTADGTDVTPSPSPTETITIPAAAPVLETATMSTSGGTVTVTAVGYSTSREMVSGQFQFYTSSGPILTPVSVPLSSAFATWYQSSASNPYGSQFTLTIPFTVAGNAADITSVIVSLTNTKGTSTSLQTVPGH